LGRFLRHGDFRSGYTLDSLAQKNLGLSKSLSGELAPMATRENCLNDVVITRKLYEKRHKLIDPTNGNLLNLLEN